MDQKIKIFNEHVRSAKNIAIFAHKNPDGDALCSVLAMARLIQLNFGKTPLCVYDGNIPDNLDNVPDRHKIKYFEHVDMTRPFDLAIVLDYGTIRHLGGAMPIAENAKYIIEIDHHINDDHIGNLCINDVNASSVGEILYEIIQHGKFKSDSEINDLLAISMLTDTGFFKYSRSGKPLRIMAELVDGGVNIGKLANGLNNKPKKTVLTEASVVSRTEFFYHGRLALATVNKKDYKNLDGRGEIILNLLGQIHGVDYVVLLKQQKENQIGFSMRGRDHAVNKFAVALGGGGHEFASGGVINGQDLETVRAKIIELFRGE